MSKRTYICLDCRTSKRAEAAYGRNTDFRCSQCQKGLMELPWRWRIPKKIDDVEWGKLGEMMREIEKDWLPCLHAEGADQLAELDRYIDSVSGQKATEAREKKLKYLRWQREEIVKKYRTDECS